MGLVRAVEYTAGELIGLLVVFGGVAMLSAGAVLPAIVLVVSGLAALPSVPVTPQRRVDILIAITSFALAYVLLA